MNFRTTMLPHRLARQRTAICTALIAALTFGTAAFAQACKSRGDLDPLYCDANGDLVAGYLDVCAAAVQSVAQSEGSCQVVQAHMVESAWACHQVARGSNGNHRRRAGTAR